MEKFSNIFEKNKNTKDYKFSVDVQFEGFESAVLKGTIRSYSESDAGEQIDKMMDEFPTLVKYEIEDIEENA